MATLYIFPFQKAKMNIKKLLIIILLIPPLLGGVEIVSADTPTPTPTEIPDVNCPIGEPTGELSLEYVRLCGECVTPAGVGTGLPTSTSDYFDVTPIATLDIFDYLTPTVIIPTSAPQPTQQPTASAPEYYVDDSQATGDFTIVYTPIGGWSSSSYFNHSVTCSDGDLLGIIFRNQLEAGSYFGNQQYWQPFSNVGGINTKESDLIFVENGQNNSNITAQAESILGITFDLGIGSGLWFSGDTYSWQSKSQYYGNSSGSYNVNTFGGLCFGIPPVEQVPTQIPPPVPTSSIPISCNEYDYADEFVMGEPVVTIGNITVTDGTCFTLLPGYELTVGVESVSWDEVELCPKYVNLPEMTLLGIEIPTSLIMLPFVLFIVGMVMKI